jgi:hypothetical protein
MDERARARQTGSKPAPAEASWREQYEGAKLVMMSWNHNRRMIRVGVRRAGVRHLNHDALFHRLPKKGALLIGTSAVGQKPRIE